MNPKTLWRLTTAVFWEWWDDNTFRLSAALALYTIFSIAPILLIAISLAGFVFGQEAAQGQIVSQISGLVGDQGGQAVDEVMEATEGVGRSPLAMTVGLVTLVVGSTVVFAELQAALNHVWDVRAAPTRGVIMGLIRDRLLSFGLALAVVFLLLVSMVVSAALAGAQAYLDQRMPDIHWLWRILHSLTSFVIITFLFALIYRYLPDVKITWRDVAIGSIVTAMLFGIGKFAIGAYMGKMAFASSYGAAGSFVVLLIWIYYSALIFFFGAEFTQVYARRYGSRIRPQPHAVRVGRKPDNA